MSSINTEFDFDYWVSLYIDDKKQYEIQRLALIAEEINKIEDLVRRQRYEAMMWRFEQDMKKIKDDTERLNQVIALFWKQCRKFREVLS